jgi:molybdate-binding protein/DNA-binding XRE family transcriptional regulator
VLENGTIMAQGTMLENDVRAFRTRLGYSQEELARRSGVSRAGISAIETGRLVPSTAAALALAAALGCTVETLFRLPRAQPAEGSEGWAWPVHSASCRYWCALVAGRRRFYPVEVSPLGLLPHDGTFRDGARHDHPGIDPARTLVLACCDPAAGLLAAELARVAELRLIVLPRSSRKALELMAQGLIHAAGVHLARAEDAEGNSAAVLPYLGTGVEREYRLLRVADWDEGIALAPEFHLGTIRAAVGAKLRWVGREPGSGARQCLDEVLGRSANARTSRPLHEALDHRSVASAIRARWADAGICLRLASEEADLGFLSVREEAYEICFPDFLAQDPRIRALLQVVRSVAYRRLLDELPGYGTTRTGELHRTRVGSQGPGTTR